MIIAKLKKNIQTPNGPDLIDVNFTISDGEFVALFGESGAGKTTVLRMLAGLTIPDEGYIEVSGQVWFDSQKNFSLPVQQRHTGFVFQEYSLFPHMSVLDNLLFADQEQGADVNQWLKLMDLEGLKNQK